MFALHPNFCINNEVKYSSGSSMKQLSQVLMWEWKRAEEINNEGSKGRRGRRWGCVLNLVIRGGGSWVSTVSILLVRKIHHHTHFTGKFLTYSKSPVGTQFDTNPPWKLTKSDSFHPYSWLIRCFKDFFLSNCEWHF